MSEMAEAATLHASVALMAVEPLSSCLAEILDLGKRHFAETARYASHGCTPDVAAYQAMEANGSLRVFTLRMEGMLIGYCTMIVRRHHHSDQIRAIEDLLYIMPECRGRGAEFIFWIDEQLTIMGAEVVYRGVQSTHNHGTMFERQGYQATEVVWSKSLGDDHG